MAEQVQQQSGALRLAIVGGGPGGYPAAFQAAERGFDVTVIDPEANPGGVCLYRGCIPSKALLHVARLLGEAREAPACGVSFGEPRVDLERLRAWRDDVVGKLTGGLGQQFARRGIRHVRGHARFVDPRTLEVSALDGSVGRLAFDAAIVATGSRPSGVPGIALASPRVLDSTGALALAEVPPSLLVVGGGYIGLELGSVYAALGSRVSVVEMTEGLLPGCDRDLVSVLSRRIGGLFAEVLLRTTVIGMEEAPEGVRVRLRGKDGQERDGLWANVLVAVGRRPNSAGLGLETTRVAPDQRGFVPVDAERRTAEPTIWAIGDVAGEPMLAHKATAEARIAVASIAGERAAFAPRAVPAVVFTDPEIAWCGLTETQARAQKRQVRTAKLPWGASGRALTLGRPEGLTKIVTDPGTGRILGVGVAGPGAGELIAEGVLAIESEATAADLRRTIHPHPTLSETIGDAVEMLFAGGSRTPSSRP